MTDIITRLARPAALAIEPYVWEPSNDEVARQFGMAPSAVIRFDTNTAPLPPPCLPSVLERVGADPRVNEYFDSSYASLAVELARHVGYGIDHLVIGAGADEILDIVAKSFLDPSDEVVVPVPTYAMYAITAATMGARIRTVPSRQDLGFDVDAIIAAASGAKLVYLCNPNNPTGRALALDDVARLVRSVACMVVIDEAYAEFSGESMLPLVAETPRLVVVRTLSKAYSLAGARLGYAISDPETVSLMNRVRPPNSISYITAVLAETAVRDDDAMHNNVAWIIKQRSWLARALADLGLEVTPSCTNFVLARTASAAVAARVYHACLRQGMVLRYYAQNPLLNTYLRITARRPADNERVVHAIGEALSA